MLTINATVGSADANSFVTEAEAIEYASARLNLVGWTTVAGIECTENEKKALIEATRELNVLSYKGRKLSGAQRLSWPRAYAEVPDEDQAYAIIVPDVTWPMYYDGLPVRLKEATIELAFEFLRAGTTDIARLDTSTSVIRKKTDVLETEWAPGSRSATGLGRFPRVARLIAPLLESRGNDVVRS